jgi:hypothetical protein
MPPKPFQIRAFGHANFFISTTQQILVTAGQKYQYPMPNIPIWGFASYGRNQSKHCLISIQQHH